MKKDLLALIFLLILSFWAIKPLLSSGFFPMHDDTQVGRIVEMGRALREGQFPVRWVGDLGYGYGYPLFNFYGPLPYYAGGFLYALGITGLTATKITFALGILLAGAAMYFFASRFFGRMGGLVAALFYTYAPYHAVDIYVRGAVGEFWALVFLPLLLWGILKGKLSDKAAILIGAIGLSGVIISHTILGYVTLVFYLISLVAVGLGAFVFKKGMLAPARLAKILVLGLGISAFFWLPAITEMNLTSVAGQISITANFHDHFVCLNELWDSPWGYGGSAPGCLDGFSFKLGKLSLILASAAFIFWLLNKNRSNFTPTILSSTAIFAGAVFMMVPLSTQVWEIIPDFAYIQYPWRFITFAILSLSTFAGSLLVFIKSKAFRIIATAAIIILLLWFNAKLFVPQYLYERPSAAFETGTELKWRVSKISDEYLPPDFVKPENAGEIPGAALSSTPDYDIETVIDTATYARYNIRTKKETLLTIRRTYFPGWKYFISGREVVPKIAGGLPEILMPEGQNNIEISFTNTRVRTFGNIISLVTLIFLLIYYGKKTYA